MFSIGKEELVGQPVINEGDLVTCPKCGQKHKANFATNSAGEKTNTLVIVKCTSGTLYLVGIDGALLLNRSKKP